MARTEKTFLLKIFCANVQPQTHNTQCIITMAGCCELQRWLAISWCHNESNNKQHVRIERHVTAASMICDMTAKSCYQLWKSLSIYTQKDLFTSSAHNIIKALIDQPADHTNIESQNSQTTSSCPYVATAVPTICNSLLATNKSCDLNRSAAVREHHFVFDHATHHLSVVQ